MKKIYFSFCLLFFSNMLLAPPNCEVFKNDELCYEACQEAINAIRKKQGSWQSQEYFDRSLELCPSFDYSHMEKAVPYLKRGDFISWKKMIDRSVELDPLEHLGYRGWCRLQFLRDYEGAIADIERLDEINPHDIGYSQNGDYHLTIALALCYKEIGQKEKALKIIEGKLIQENYSAGLYDYYHLGVLQFEMGEYEEALKSFEKQIFENDYMGETYYFMAKTFKELGNEKAYSDNLNKAKSYYTAGKYRIDTYTEPIDKIYLMDIEKEIDSGFN